MITVSSGANRRPYPLEGQKVGAVRNALAAIEGIADGAAATVNRQPVDEDYELQDGDELDFAQTLAQKG